MADIPVLVDQYGNPIKRELLTQAIAGPTVTGVRSPITGYPSRGLNPSRLAAILREADDGEPLRFFELAEEVEEKNPHYAGVLGTRKRQVSQLPATVDPASNDPEHVKHAEEVRAWLKRGELQFELFDMLDAIGKGLSYTEIIWDTSEGQWWPRALEWRDPRWFRPDRADLTTPRLRELAGDVPLEPFKFIRTVIRAKSGLPVRSGVARAAVWNWLFKAFTERDWAIFTQTYGQPIRTGKYPAGATEADKDTLFRAVANIAGDCAAIIPESMLIEFVEAKNVGPGNDLYIKRADWLDAQCSKLVLGQTGTTDATPGKLGGSDDHTQVREDIERADSAAVSAVVNRDLVVPFVQLNHGPQQKYPTVKIGRPEEKDTAQLVDAVEKLVPRGLKVSVGWMGAQLGIPEPKTGEEVLTVPAPAPSSFDVGEAVRGITREESGAPSRQPVALQSSLVADRDAHDVERLAAEVEQLAQPATDDMIDRVRAVVESATSLDDLRAQLTKLELPDAKLAAALKLGLIMARLSGRAEISDSAAAP